MSYKYYTRHLPAGAEETHHIKETIYELKDKALLIRS
jgi:hypothetical protein